MSKARTLVCCLFIALLSHPLLADDAPLAWKFKVGDELHYRMTQNMDMEMTMGTVGQKSDDQKGADQKSDDPKIDSRKIETAVDQIMDMTWKVTKIDDQGVATIAQSIKRVQMDMQAPGQPKMHYDTDADAAPAGYAAMVAPLFKAMIAEPFEMTITPRGEILDLKMPKKMVEALDKVPGAAGMGEMFSDEGFKKMMQQSSLVLPKPEDMKPGYEWTRQAEVKNAQFGKLATTATYRYLGAKEVDGKPYEVFGLSIEMKFGESPGGVQMDVTKQDSQGEIYFSREAGRLESSKLKQDMDMNITAAGQAMSQHMVQTVLLEYVEK